MPDTNMKNPGTADAPRLTLDQRRASDALSKVQVLADRGSYGHYVSYASALPAQIISNGLGQAMATLLAAARAPDANSTRRDAPHYVLCQHLASWLSEQVIELRGAEGRPLGDPIQVLEVLMRNDQRVYLRAQGEALAYLDWLKKFARALLTTEGEESE